MSCNDPCGDHIQINIDSAGQGPVGPPGPAAQTAVWKYYLQPGDTIVSGPDASGTELAYEPASVQVFLNGVLLSDDDYTIDSGNSIVLNEAATGVNDVLLIHSQVGPVDFDPTNDHALLQSQIDDNRTDIDGLRVDVDQHSQDIADLQADQTAQVVTTADVVTVGALPFADPNDDPKTQQEANWILHDWIKASEKEIEDARQEFQGLDKDVSDLSQTVTDLSTDVDGISISVATNTVNISKNSSDISQLQVDVGNITVPDLGPLDVRVTDLETLTVSHSSDLVDLRTDVDALGAPVDLGPLNDAISDNSVAIAKNTTDIASIKVVDAQQTGQINDLQIAVGNLEAIDHDHSNHALIDQDNVFTVSQTIKDGIKLTGSQAFIECDTGTPLSVRNNNFSNAVINVMRSNGDVAISLEASGHIRGVATDPNDGTCSANVDYVQQMTGTIDLTDYALQADLDQEEADRIAGDKSLQDQVDALSASGGYNDAWIQPAIDAGDADLQVQIDALSAAGGYDDSWIQPAIDAGDAATLTVANAYTDTAIAGIVPPAPPDLSIYETIAKSEADDADLQSQIDALSASGGYNDAWIQPAIDAGDAATLTDANAYSDTLFAGVTHPDPPDLAPYETIVKSESDDAATLTAAKAYTDSEVAAITHPDPPDLAPYETIVKSESDDAATLVAAKGYTDQALVPYETKQKSVADDAATLTSAKSYTDQKFNAVVHPSPTIVSATEPATKTDGTNWFDTVRLELFVRASSSWLPSSPLGARVTQGEIVQAQIIDEVSRKMGVSGQNEVDTTFRIKSSSKTFVSTNGNELSLYNLRSPTDDSHAVNLGYANEHYQRSQKPIGFKIDQSAVCSLSTTPRSGEFCGLNNSSPGSSTAANNYFGNFNAGIRVHIDKLKNPLGETFAPNERYNIAGTVTIFGKTSGKLFFRHSITMVSRDTSHDYVTLTFATRVPTFGTGAITAEAESKYIVIVDGLTAAATSTTLIPEGEPTDE